MSRASPEQFVPNVYQDLSEFYLDGSSQTWHTKVGTTYPSYYRVYTSAKTAGWNAKYKKRRRTNSLKLPFNNHFVHGYRKVSSAYKKSVTTYLPDGRSYGTGTAVTHSDYVYTFNPSDLVSTAELGTTVNKALDRLYEKLSSTKFNAAQALGERAQTAKLIADTATRVAQAARSLRRADLVGFAKSLSLDSGDKSLRKRFDAVSKSPIRDRLANHWLEFQYGWKPLLSDVDSACELLAKQNVGTDFPFRSIGASASASFSSRKDSGEWRIFIGSRYRVKLTCDVNLDNASRALLSQTGISNPLLLAWELLPYSFVVDWFVPVGNYLNSLTAADGYTISRIGQATREEWSMSCDCSADITEKVGSDVRRVVRSGELSVSEWRYRRTLLSSLPAYGLHFRSPLGGKPLERFATALSLMNQLFSRK